MSHSLYELLNLLDDASIHFTLARYDPGAVNVTLSLVGERVEIEVFEDGHMTVSRFVGSEDSLGGFELVKEIIAANRDD